MIFLNDSYINILLIYRLQYNREVIEDKQNITTDYRSLNSASILYLSPVADAFKQNDLNVRTVSKNVSLLFPPRT
jgi:hypothetical protein